MQAPIVLLFKYKTPDIGRIVCDHHFAVARTTNTAIKARVAPPPRMTWSSSSDCFGSLDYIADHSGELRLFKKTSSEDNKSPTLYPPLGFLGANLEVLD
jgi:hypothetical protein